MHRIQLSKHEGLKPAGWIFSSLLFGIPSAVLIFMVYGVNPLLVKAGVPLIVSFTLTFYGVFYGLLLSTFVFYWRGGHPMTHGAMIARLRLRSLSGREWALVGLVVLVALIGDAALESTMQWMATTIPLPIADALPTLLDPHVSFVIPPTEYMGVSLDGNFWVLGIYALSLFGNIIGEEIWWRGYILPMQERTFGKWAWLINGLLWVFVFHAFMWWAYPTLLITGLLTPLIAQRLRSTWAAVVIHGTGNALFLLLLLAGVLSSES